MAVNARRKQFLKRRRELLAGVIVLSAIFLALVMVAVVLFRGEAPQQVAKPPMEPLPTFPSPSPLPYEAAEFSYDGEMMTLSSPGALPGIDVSRHQGEIDWQQVAGSGVQFVLLRIGYRTYGDGAIYEDPYADANYLGAKDAGLKVGVYFFSQAINLQETLEEARWVLQKLRGWELDLPVVYDWEVPAQDARTQHVTPGQLTAFTRVFNRVMENNGYDTMLYFNRHHAETRLYLYRLLDIPHWLAMYQEDMTYPYDIAIWQYSDHGTVPGIDAPVDRNILLPGTPLWQALVQPEI